MPAPSCWAACRLPARHGRGRSASSTQDLGLVDDLSVAENIALVNGFPRRRRLISWRQVRAVAKQVLAVLDAPIDVERPVRGLTATERSIVGIARAVSVHAEVLVLDEPTAALPAGDVEKLFGVLRKLRGAGVALIYVTHRIDEVFRLADRVTVLRNGRVVASEPISEITPEKLIGQILCG